MGFGSVVLKGTTVHKQFLLLNLGETTIAGLRLVISGEEIHEYGRAYFGLHRYKKAIECFEKELKISDDPYIWDFLARAYYRIGDSKKTEEVLKKGLKRHPDNKHLQLTYVSHALRTMHEEGRKESNIILSRLYSIYPDNGRIILQLCKLYIFENRIPELMDLWKNTRNNIYPSIYKKPIETNILIAQERWNEAVDLLKDIPDNDEHLVSLKQRDFLNWTISELDVQKKVEIAKNGLDFKIDPHLENNIPLMINRAKLAWLAKNKRLYRKIVKKIINSNPKIQETMIHDENRLDTEDDNFSRDYFLSEDEINVS